eukprot:PhM_4_TR14355/c0_g1_i1/m.93967
MTDVINASLHTGGFIRRTHCRLPHQNTSTTNATTTTVSARCVCFDAESTMMYVATTRFVATFDVLTGARVGMPFALSCSPSHLLYLQERRAWVACLDDGRVLVVSAMENKVLAEHVPTRAAERRPHFCAALHKPSPDYSYLFYVRSRSKDVQALSLLTSNKDLARFSGHKKFINCMDCHSTHPIMACSSVDGTIRVYHTSAVALYNVVPGTGAGYVALVFCSSNVVVSSDNNDNTMNNNSGAGLSRMLNRRRHGAFDQLRLLAVGERFVWLMDVSIPGDPRRLREYRSDRGVLYRHGVYCPSMENTVLTVDANGVCRAYRTDVVATADSTHHHIRGTSGTRHFNILPLHEGLAEFTVPHVVPTVGSIIPGEREDHQGWEAQRRGVVLVPHPTYPMLVTLMPDTAAAAASQQSLGLPIYEAVDVARGGRCLVPQACLGPADVVSVSTAGQKVVVRLFPLDATYATGATGYSEHTLDGPMVLHKLMHSRRAGAKEVVVVLAPPQRPKQTVSRCSELKYAVLSYGGVAAATAVELYPALDVEYAADGTLVVLKGREVHLHDQPIPIPYFAERICVVDDGRDMAAGVITCVLHKVMSSEIVAARIDPAGRAVTTAPMTYRLSPEEIVLELLARDAVVCIVTNGRVHLVRVDAAAGGITPLVSIAVRGLHTVHWVGWGTVMYVTTEHVGLVSASGLQLPLCGNNPHTNVVGVAPGDALNRIICIARRGCSVFTFQRQAALFEGLIAGAVASGDEGVMRRIVETTDSRHAGATTLQLLDRSGRTDLAALVAQMTGTVAKARGCHPVGLDAANAWPTPWYLKLMWAQLADEDYADALPSAISARAAWQSIPTAHIITLVSIAARKGNHSVVSSALAGLGAMVPEVLVRLFAAGEKDALRLISKNPSADDSTKARADMLFNLATTKSNSAVDVRINAATASKKHWSVVGSAADARSDEHRLSLWTGVAKVPENAAAAADNDATMTPRAAGGGLDTNDHDDAASTDGGGGGGNAADDEEIAREQERLRNEFISTFGGGGDEDEDEDDGSGGGTKRKKIKFVISAAPTSQRKPVQNLTSLSLGLAPPPGRAIGKKVATASEDATTASADAATTPGAAAATTSASSSLEDTLLTITAPQECIKMVPARLEKKEYADAILILDRALALLLQDTTQLTRKTTIMSAVKSKLVATLLLHLEAEKKKGAASDVQLAQKAVWLTRLPRLARDLNVTAQRAALSYFMAAKSYGIALDTAYTLQPLSKDETEFDGVIAECVAGGGEGVNTISPALLDPDCRSFCCATFEPLARRSFAADGEEGGGGGGLECTYCGLTFSESAAEHRVPSATCSYCTYGTLDLI